MQFGVDLKPFAMPKVNGLLIVQCEHGKEPLRDRCRTEELGWVDRVSSQRLSRQGLLHSEGADRGATQLGEMPVGAQRSAEIACQRANVGP